MAFKLLLAGKSNLVEEPAVITVGKITSGVRFNIIPESAELIGTVRTLDPKMRELIMRRMTEMAADIAKAYGGSATIEWQNNTVVTYNDPALTAQMVPTLQAVAGKENVVLERRPRAGRIFPIFRSKYPDFIFSWAE